MRAVKVIREKDYLKAMFSKLEAVLGSLLLTALITGGLVTNAVPAIAAGSGTWTLTGGLNIARTGHTATLLPNGQVVVAGGLDASGTLLAGAELFNPATGRWSVTGSMVTARRGHTATLLPSGLVLVAGGTTSAGTTAAAELYNPATGKWSSTGSMTTSRSSHTAVLLPGGLVLAAGGLSGSTYLSSAEFYDPSMGFWQATGSMHFPSLSQAALLQNGQVLIAGSPQNGALRTAELYSSGQWILTASMNNSHSGSTAAPLLNGGALICGRSIAFSAYCEVYTPSTNTWTVTHNTGSDPIATPLLLLDTADVLMAGGQHSDGASNICLLYIPSANSWLATGRMNVQRIGHTVTLLANGQVLAAGGKNGASAALATAEIYTP